LGGGGQGVLRNTAPIAINNGTANTGGGGGGSGDASANVAGAGGSGVVILKYSDTLTITLTTVTGTTAAPSGGFKVTTITAGTGTVSFA
jgi:hypothetical protein